MYQDFKELLSILNDSKARYLVAETNKRHAHGRSLDNPGSSRAGRAVAEAAAETDRHRVECSQVAPLGIVPLGIDKPPCLFGLAAEPDRNEGTELRPKG